MDHELVGEMLNGDPNTKRVVCSCGKAMTIYFRGHTDEHGKEWTVDEVIERAIDQIKKNEQHRLWEENS